MYIPKRKIVTVVSIVLLILAYPLSLIGKELWILSDGSLIAITSFLVGVGVGALLVSLLVPKS